MDRQTVIQNILTNYSQYGITEEIIIPLINSGIQQGLSYDFDLFGFKNGAV